MRQQRRAQQAGDAIVQADQVRFEARGITVEHGFQIGRRRARGLRQHAGGDHEVADIGVFRGQFQRLGVGEIGLVVAAEAGERVAAQAEHAGIGDTIAPGRLGQVGGAVKHTLAHRQHDRGGTQADITGAVTGGLRQHRSGGAFQRHAERAGTGGATRIGVERFAQARQGVFRAVHLQKDHAEHGLGLAVARCQDHCLGGVSGGAGNVVRLHAGVGAGPANTPITLAGVTVLTDNEWHHVAMVRDVHLKLAQLHEALGQDAKAAGHYRHSALANIL